MLKLYDYFRSSASYRVRIALHLKNLPFDAIPIHLLNEDQHKQDYHAINPQHLVPTFDDGNIILTQSLAIIEYLEECYPTPSIFPVDKETRAKARAFALTIAADIHPLNNLRVLRYLTDNFKVDENQKNNWYQHWISLGLQSLETFLTKESVFSCAFSETPSVADICLIPQLFNAKRFNCPLDAYPRLLAIDQHCETLTAFQNAKGNAYESSQNTA